MKRFAAMAAFLVLCLAYPTPALARYGVKKYPTKETKVDMKSMNNICVGWVDLGVEQWAALGYDTKGEWSAVVDGLNDQFSATLPVMYLSGYKVTAAKNKDDVSTTGCDLAIRFSDVVVDYDHYHLIIAVHFIDPKTNAEIGLIPARPYFGDEWGLRGYLSYALKDVSTKIAIEVTGAPPPKKK